MSLGPSEWTQDNPHNHGYKKHHPQSFFHLLYTPLKFNMEPENTPLEKENHLPNHYFQVLC